jgi:Ca2+-binding EF-hand superfamily protein
LSAQTIKDLQAHFDYADRDHSSTLERRELETFWQTAFAKVCNCAHAVMSVGCVLTHVQPADQRVLDWTYRLFDTDRTGSLSFSEFVLGFGMFNRELQLTRVRPPLVSCQRRC